MTEVGKFATRLNNLRGAKGFTKSSLAKRLGVSTTCVWNWEEGNTHPRPGALARIAAVLSTTEAFLERGVTPSDAPGGASSPLGAVKQAGVAEIIRRAREDIAAAAGLTVDQVKVVLEYGT